SRVGDPRLWNQTASERDLSDQFPSQSPPSKRSRHNGGHFGSLLAESDRTIACRGEIERHPDLVHREKSRVGSEFSKGPTERCQTRHNIRNRGRKAEQGVLFGDRSDHVMRNRLSKRIKRARQRESQILAFLYNPPDAVVRGIEIEGKRVGGTQKAILINLQVATGPAAANQQPDSFRAPAWRKMGRGKVRL